MSLALHMLAPFYWKLLKIGIRSAKDHGNYTPIFQIHGSAPVLLTPPVFYVVLLHTEASGRRRFRGI